MVDAWPGPQGGTYKWRSIITVCHNCHARIHDGQMVIHGRYLCTDGRWCIHFTDEYGEHWMPEEPEVVR